MTKEFDSVDHSDTAKAMLESCLVGDYEVCMLLVLTLHLCVLFYLVVRHSLSLIVHVYIYYVARPSLYRSDLHGDIIIK